MTVRCAGSTKVQSLLIPRARFTKAAANQWARTHGYKPTCKLTGSGKGRFYHCRQKRIPVVGSTRFGKSGIIARMGCP